MSTEQPMNNTPDNSELLRNRAISGCCGKCSFRDSDGYCRSEKLSEDYGSCIGDRSDMLVYPYMEGGRFWVGPKFGCVHFRPNAAEGMLK